MKFCWFPCKLYLGPQDMEIIKKKHYLWGPSGVMTIRLYNISFGTGSVHHRGETSTKTMDNQFFIYLQRLKLFIGLFR